MSFTSEELQQLLNVGFTPEEVSNLARSVPKPSAPVTAKRVSNATMSQVDPVARRFQRNNAMHNAVSSSPRRNVRETATTTPSWSSNLNKKANKNLNRAGVGLNTAADAVHGATDAVETANDISKFIGFNKGKGLSIGGKNVGKYVPYGVGIYQGLDALGGLSEMSDLNADADTLTSQILTSAAGNPLISSYLTSDDLSLLGKLQRGTYDASAGVGDATSNLGNLLTGAGSGALMGLAGGVPGAIIGGIGGLINSGIDNMNAETTNNTARLEALYQNLLNAEQQYKSMRRPNFTGLGIQQQYQNMYM